jgi:hypothetical protein
MEVSKTVVAVRATPHGPTDRRPHRHDFLSNHNFLP